MNTYNGPNSASERFTTAIYLNLLEATPMNRSAVRVVKVQDKPSSLLCLHRGWLTIENFSEAFFSSFTSFVLHLRRQRWRTPMYSRLFTRLASSFVRPVLDLGCDGERRTTPWLGRERVVRKRQPETRPQPGVGPIRLGPGLSPTWALAWAVTLKTGPACGPSLSAHSKPSSRPIPPET
ncbi:hypothetical protein HYC85_027719 [Camellia sinensis]|uniref:Uncharacterized protein n=1 Tax=Camellia sinensis TaxID=4442 RepID=A0A7J7FV52_CAMSI|nr:hypothetical protein HYC85_027719 [Camellia sinensis]